MRSFADFLISNYRGGEIWVKEKVQPLKINNALFLEPHTRCYVMCMFFVVVIRQDLFQAKNPPHKS